MMCVGWLVVGLLKTSRCGFDFEMGAGDSGAIGEGNSVAMAQVFEIGE
jgi:hypothetical protein